MATTWQQHGNNMLLQCYCQVVVHAWRTIAMLLPWQYVSSDFQQATWARVIKMSIANGNPWTDRYGVVQNAEPAGMAEAVLAKWFADKGVHLGKWQ
jgi:hypothetical protein